MAKNNKKSKSQVVTNKIISLLVIVMSIISFAKLGFIGVFFDKVIRYLFGDFHFVIYLGLIIFSLFTLFYDKEIKLSKKQIAGYFVLLLSFLLLSSLISNYGFIKTDEIKYFLSNSSDIFNYNLKASGGLFGVLIYGFFTFLFDVLGSILVLPFLLLISAFLILDLKELNKKLVSFREKNKRKRLKRERKRKAKKANYKIGDENKVVKEKEVEKKKSAFITLADSQKDKAKANVTQTSLDLEEVDNQIVDGKTYHLPPLDLLDTKQANLHSKKNKNAAEIKGDKLVEVLKEFNINTELSDIHIGPSVTKFEIRPETSVKVSKIASVQDNIKMELAARNIRIEAPIPGKNTVGVEIPNIEKTPVKLFELLNNMPKSKANNPLLFTLGKDLMGNTVYSDLTKMPHLLIAGATGAGKSVAMNAIITTILLRSTPAQVRLLLIDPKKVEFSNFKHVPHLLCDIVTEPQKASNALLKVVDLMDKRYRDFAEIGVKNLASYKKYQKDHPKEDLENLELIVVVIDELADLMVVAGKEVEQSIQRITQLARAAGIHLIVATQRPSTDVITGVIKANIPSRISFAVSSGIDSRTILDTTGAERLLGNGDMLYYPVSMSAPLRLQGVYVTDSEVAKVANYTGKQPSPEYFDEFKQLEEEQEDGLALMPKAFDDPLYEDVKTFVVREQKASTSLIQRSFGIGYNRAARIIDALESKDIIGPMQGSKPRDVYLEEKDLEEEN